VLNAAAHRSVPPATDAGISLNEQKRRAELERISADDAALTRALVAASGGAHDGTSTGDPPEVLWRALILREAEHVLADSIQAGRGNAAGRPLPAPGEGAGQAQGAKDRK